jgi:histidinol-phosphate phosphatase family protein
MPSIIAHGGTDVRINRVGGRTAVPCSPGKRFQAAPVCGLLGAGSGAPATDRSQIRAARLLTSVREASQRLVHASAQVPLVPEPHVLEKEPDGVLGVNALFRDPAAAPAAVLLDRDGTLVVDVPYNGDPARVRPVPGAREALERLRAAGVALAVVSNQSAIGLGRLSPEQVDAVNRRVDELLGPLGPWVVCPHAPHDGCSCRKPAPGLVLEAARRLGVDPEECVVVGDVGADVEAARAAGARSVLVPTPSTRREEVAAAPVTAPDLRAAVDLVLRGAGS